MNNYEIITKFRNIPRGLQAVCVGTTQAHYALDFSLTDINGFNMACYKNSMQFSRLLLNKHSDRIQKGAVILIALQYPLFCIGNFGGIAKENAWQYSRLLFHQNPYCSFVRQIYERLIPCNKTIRHFMEEHERLEARSRYRNHYKPWELERMCNELVRYGWEQEIEVDDYISLGHMKKCKKVDDAIISSASQAIELINYCNEQDWRPVLIGLPYSMVLNNHVPASFKTGCFSDIINDICKETGCSFQDYSADTRLGSIHDYIDIWYLNARGRARFTDIVVEELISKMI